MVARYLAAASLALVVTALGHYYLYLRLVVPLAGDGAQGWMAVAGALWALSFFGVPATRVLPHSLRLPVESAVYVWVGTSYIFLLLCLLTAPLSFLLELSEGAEGSLAILVVAGGLGLALWSLYAGSFALVVETVIPVRAGLPEGVDDLRIVQLSDVHASSLIGPRRLRRIVDKVHSLSPDLICITGDLVDGTVRQLEKTVAPLGDLRAPHGVMYVTGNHEYYCGPEDWKRHAQERWGWHVLSNRSVEIQTKQGALVRVFGVEDRTWGHLQRPKAPAGTRLALATAGLDETLLSGSLNLLLAHQPKDAPLVRDYPWLDVQISGHTHGGQLWPLHLFVYRDQTYNKGLYQLWGNQRLYVNQGTGVWGPPMRLGTRCEISVLRFRRSPAP